MAESSTLTPKPGDHLKVKRRLYTHHGIYLGGNKIIHYAPPPGKGATDGIGWRQILGANSEINIIYVADLEDFEFHEDIKSTIVHYDKDHSYPPLKVLARARSRLGENGYNLWGNNCEHFVSWCKQTTSGNQSVSLWESVWEGALLGLGTGTKARQWAGMAIGAGMGALIGAARHWLRNHKLTSIYAEFASYATALYFSLIDEKRKYPFGNSFYHVSQREDEHHPLIPAGRPDKEIIFVYKGSLFSRSNKNDWLVTERALIQPGHDQYIDFHNIAAISHGPGKLVITDLDGNTCHLPVRYADPRSVALFLMAAVSGTLLESKDIRRNLLAKLKEFVCNWKPTRPTES